VTISRALTDRFLQWTLAALLIFSPLAFGTVEVWSIAAAELLVLFMGSVWIARMISDGKIQLEATSLNTPIVLFLGLMLFQMLPLPLSAIKHLSPAAYAVYRDAGSTLNLQMGWRTISLDPMATREEFLKVLTYATLFWVILNNFRQRRQLEGIVAIIIGTGFFLAVFGIIQEYAWNGKIYWVRELTQGGSPFGPYVNRNHFAGYMEIVIPLTIGYLLAQSPLRREPISLRGRFLLWTSAQTSKSILLMFAAMFMAASLLLTGSRGGLVSLTGSMVFFAVMIRMKRTSRRKGSRVVLAFCSLGLIAAIWIGGNSALLSVERLEKGFQEPSTEQRLVLWQDTLRMAKDFIRFGSGFNTFEEVYPKYKTLPVQAVFQYAHNDYLQLLAEGGIVPFGLAVWSLIAWYRKVVVKWLERHDPFAAYMTLGGMTAVFAILIHSLTDFNLHIPANALTIVTAFAMTFNTVRVFPSADAFDRGSEVL
jgi:O-antigen ligase